MCDGAEKDLYAVLGCSPTDSAQQLRHTYQKLALQFHPDRLVGAAPSAAESGARRFLEVDAAWRVLSDPTSRRQYDQQRRAQELKQDWPVDAIISLEDMSWDQDECVYTYGCRCGGAFSVCEEELEAGRRDGQDHRKEGQRAAAVVVVVCCDTCSLSVCVTWSGLTHSHTQL